MENRFLGNIVFAFGAAVVGATLMMAIVNLLLSSEMQWTMAQVGSFIVETMLSSVCTCLWLLPSMACYQLTIQQKPTAGGWAALFYFGLLSPIWLFLIWMTLQFHLGSLFTGIALLVFGGGMFTGYFTLRYLNRQQNANQLVGPPPITEYALPPRDRA